jgi:hypothetical protein
MPTLTLVEIMGEVIQDVALDQREVNHLVKLVQRELL